MSTGFGFGANRPANSAPAFGSSTSFSFGNPTTPAQQPAAAPSFGMAAAQSTPAPTLGATPSLFGTPTQGGTNLFGTPTAAPTTTAPATNLSFGAGNLSFGATPATTSILGGTTATSTPQLQFGLTGGQPASGGLTLGTGLGTSATTSAPLFGLSTTTSTAGALKLGATTSTTTAGGLTFGLGGLASTSSAAPTATTTAPSIGLGGIATPSQSKSSTVTTQKEIPPKDQPLPNEILQTVESFKEMVKQQKQYSSEITRCSVRDFRRVEQEIDQLNHYLNELELQLQKNRQVAEKLKYDSAKTFQNVEMAQRTQDFPPGLQYENTAPLKFFVSLADQFERDMQSLKVRIEAADSFVKNFKNPGVLTPQDLSTGMKRLHETFVALAGRLHSIHSQVSTQKETYLNVRRHVLHDSTNPFDKLVKNPEFNVASMTTFSSPPRVASGPTPFNNLAFRSFNPGTAQHQHTTPPPAYPGFSGNTGGLTGFPSTNFGASLGNTQPAFGSTSLGQSSFNSSFQLQKPPTGNKRGKV
ncbi:nuclear pore complex protein Nup58-like isoform X2 [Anthonomus grandis grandis]|uniref:nuclear pore complex protein Nup58-like isoform X2 n=1 Tax=Anthonomus grandis grandis TaxID=2921223 RepID=UPI0021655CDC|nr:nuclear pore complex protein Nup58-like isoform X2 [Anthonomus grandis grandis]